MKNTKEEFIHRAYFHTKIFSKPVSVAGERSVAALAIEKAATCIASVLQREADEDEGSIHLP